MQGFRQYHNPSAASAAAQATSKQASVYTGAWHCAVSCWREEGAQVFVKGFWATIGRGFVVNAAIFVAFEALMSAMSE